MFVNSGRCCCEADRRVEGLRCRRNAGHVFANGGAASQEYPSLATDVAEIGALPNTLEANVVVRLSTPSPSEVTASISVVFCSASGCGRSLYLADIS